MIGPVTFILLVSTLPACLPGCSKDQADRETKDRQILELQKNSLVAENDSLRESNRKLNNELDLLKASCENLEIQKDELKRWTRDLVKACGPSVWKLGVYEYPIPHKFFQKATVQQLLSELNAMMRAKGLPEVTLKEVKDATAHVRIPQSTFLTNQMGTTGAGAYLNAVAYTLCSLKEIKCVDFDFQPGDHATPGLLCP